MRPAAVSRCVQQGPQLDNSPTIHCAVRTARCGTAEHACTPPRTRHAFARSARRPYTVPRTLVRIHAWLDCQHRMDVCTPHKAVRLPHTTLPTAASRACLSSSWNAAEPRSPLLKILPVTAGTMVGATGLPHKRLYTPWLHPLPALPQRRSPVSPASHITSQQRLSNLGLGVRKGVHAAAERGRHERVRAWFILEPVRKHEGQLSAPAKSAPLAGGRAFRA